jgi:hypothetical protein
MESPDTDDPKKRLVAYAKFRGISLQEFALNLDRSRNYFNIGGTIDSDVFRLLIAQYPDLNVYWVITGEGEMLHWNYRPHTGTPLLNPADTEDIINLRLSLEETIIMLRNHISLTKQELTLKNDIIARQNELIKSYGASAKQD